RHFVESLATYVKSQPECDLLLETEVDRIVVDGGRVTGVRTTRGETFSAERYISNVDPRRTASLIGERSLPGRWLDKLSYDYSSGNLTLYLGLRGIDLRDHGFGSHNVWHYPHDDIDAM